MKKEISIDKDKIVKYFLIMAYEDYTSSRFLLLNGYFLNGLMLASTAVEKYLKAISVNVSGEIQKFHLDYGKSVKKVFKKLELQHILLHADQLFLGLLSHGYRYRYLDNFTDKHSIGIVTNHFLGELDEYINYLDNQLSFSTNYKRGVEEKDQRIFTENYILSGIDKNVYYEKQSSAFAIEINPRTGDVLGLNGYFITPIFRENRMMLMLVGEENPEKIIARLKF